MADKFRVSVGTPWRDQWPDYFDNFLKYCQDRARKNGWNTVNVANYELRPHGGRLITTKTQGWYLRWDAEASHTAFVLKWS